MPRRRGSPATGGPNGGERAPNPVLDGIYAIDAAAVRGTTGLPEPAKTADSFKKQQSARVSKSDACVFNFETGHPAAPAADLPRLNSLLKKGTGTLTAKIAGFFRMSASQSPFSTGC
jgi:hypothetical protein